MRRREFLQHAVVGAASAATAFAADGTNGIAAEAAPTTAPATTFLFSVSTSMYPDSPFEVAIDEIVKTGAQAVDLWDTPSYPVNCMDWVWTRRPRMLREYLGNCGLKLFAFSIYWSPGNELDERLEWLAEAGGQVAVLGGGVAPDQPVSAGVERLRPLVERAEQLGLKIAGENHGGSSLNSIASMREFAELATSPALGIALAPYHMMGNGESVAEAIEAIGPKLFFFYAWQSASGMAELPGDGTLDFAPVLRALHQVGYTGYVNIFTHTRAPKDEMTQAVIRAREYLERQVLGAG
jgi:sugar phosphate isomerase/epimerase